MNNDLMVNQMQVYLAKQRYIQAVQIDNEWLKFLTNEMGFTDAKKDDYYVRQNNGQYVIFPKENFERLFELEVQSSTEQSINALMNGLIHV